MSDKKIIAVVGATGAQGGGMARAILGDTQSEFSVRALTRDVNSEKAKALTTLGAEVVQADVNVVESLKQAFSGAYGAFCVTFFWEHFSPEQEGQQVKNMAEAAKAAGLQHVIWSTLEDTREWVPLSDDRMPTLQEKYKVPHFDAKGEQDEVFEELGVPTTYLLTTFYWDNFIFFGSGPTKGPDDSLVLNMPMGDRKLPGIAAEDIGKAAYGILKRGSEMIGQRVGVAGEHLSGSEMAAALSNALGQSVSYNAVPFDVFRSLDIPGAADLGNMFQFYHDFESDLRASRDVAATRALNPELQSFGAWLGQNGNKIPLD